VLGLGLFGGLTTDQVDGAEKKLPRSSTCGCCPFKIRVPGSKQSGLIGLDVPRARSAPMDWRRTKLCETSMKRNSPTRGALHNGRLTA
jgi:hypothetical protein